MTEADKIESQWDALSITLANKFADGDTLSVESIIYLIGIQELGKGPIEFSKDDKINLMHIAICRLLEPYGYYEFDHDDPDGWPHFNLLKELPNLQAEAQSRMMKEAIIGYFSLQKLI